MHLSDEISGVDGQNKRVYVANDFVTGFALTKQFSQFPRLETGDA